MNSNVNIPSIVFIILCIIMTSCGDDTTGNDANVTFSNRSFYNVDIFYNFNPQSSDPTTSNSFLGTVDTISRTLEVTVPASKDPLLGDTFYIHYKVLLANSVDTGTTNLFIHAERSMSNISFVIESGQKYDIPIEDPPVNELRFVNGIIKVQNLTTGQYWVENYNKILPNLASSTAWLTTGQIGYYELDLPFLSESRQMDFLQTRDSDGNRTLFPSFEMERGKLYWFKILNTGITGPVVTNINPLKQVKN